MTGKNFFGKTAIFCVIFFALGVIVAGIGPCLRDFALLSGVGIPAMGAIFTSLFVGALVAQTAFGLLVNRFGIVRISGLSMVTMVVALSASTMIPVYPLIIACFFLYGAGNGLVALIIQISAAEANPERKVVALNLLALMFGIGAFAGPALASLSWTVCGNSLPSLWIGALLLAVSAVPALRALSGIRGGREKKTETEGVDGQKAVIPGSFLSLGTLGLLLFVYVGAENGMGGWITEHAIRATGMASERAAWYASAFWLALAGGRAIAAIAGNRLGARFILGSGILISVVGAAMFFLGSPSVIFVATIVIGFGYGSIYPTGFALVTSYGPGFGGFAAAMGSAGGMLLPAAQGMVLAGAGPRFSALFTLSCGVAMFVLAVISSRAGLTARTRERERRP